MPSRPGMDETTPLEWFRSGTDQVAREYAAKGVRVVCLRLAMVVHSPEKVHPFLKVLYQEDHMSYYQDGSNQWCAVDPNDAAELVGLVLNQQDKLLPGKVTNLHAYAEMISTRDISEALGEVTGLPVRPFTEEEMKEKQGFVKTVLEGSPGVVNKWTRETFGWQPKGRTLVQDIKDGHYFVKDTTK